MMRKCLFIVFLSAFVFKSCLSQKKVSAMINPGKHIINSSDFILGIDFFSNANPVDAGDTSSSLYHNVVRNLPEAVDATNQHILNFGGDIGINMPAPGFTNCDPNCDALWSSLDWSWVDARVKLMQAMHTPIKMITLYGAPNFMTQFGNDPSTPNQKPGWDNYSDKAQIDPQYNKMWADLCHYIVKRYLPMGVKYYQVWNEMKGYYAYPNHLTADRVSYYGWDFPGYTAMYNAVWDRIKNDPATAGAKIGGPYAIMTLHQANGTTSGAVGPTWLSKEGDKGKVTLKGKWGGIRPEITEGLIYWRNHAHGWDFVCVDGGPWDDAANHSGSDNPNHWTSDYVRSYWYDITKWLHDSIAEEKPVVISEVYPDGIGTDWKKSLDMMRDPSFYGLTPCKNATTNNPEPCVNLTLEWGDDEPPHFYSMTDSTGSLTPLGEMYRSYRYAYPSKTK
jgi:hypothetical protein